MERNKKKRGKDEVRDVEEGPVPETGFDQIMAALKELKGEIQDLKENVVTLEEKFDVLINEGVEMVEGAYDAVFNARWSYVVRSGEYDKKWLGMDAFCLMPGKQPRLWSEAQADVPYDPEEPWEGDEVPGVSGKLVMAVLSSQRGWPHMLFSADEIQKEKVKSLTEYNAVCDAYIRRENLRVWHIVKKSLDVWMEAKRDRGYVHPFIVTGTPGIGKSFATGSLLLYQLLHYPSDDLKVVAYFVEGKAYIFHREERRVAHYKQGGTAANEIKGMIRRGVKGYIIFDISGNSVHIGDLPDNWGIVLISSPNVKKFHEFAKRWQGTFPIYMNCYEDAEFKAALVWERHCQVVKKQKRLEDVNLESDWKVLKERIDMVGPLARYVLAGEALYGERTKEVEDALTATSTDELEHYLTKYSSGQKEWYADETKNKMVKMVRLPGSVPEQARLERVCTYDPWEEEMPAPESPRSAAPTDDVQHSIGRIDPTKFEKLALKAFTVGSFVTEVVRRLKYLPREGETEGSRSSVLAQVRARGRVPSKLRRFSTAGLPAEIVSGCLYVPVADNFPVLDGFFLVEAQGKGPLLNRQDVSLNETIVFLQVTLDEDHETSFKTVAWFRRLMAKCFSNWSKKEKYRNYEIIYVQHVGISNFKTRQGCKLGDDYNPDHPIDHPAFWDSFHQFRVELDHQEIEEVCGESSETDEFYEETDESDEESDD